MASRFPDDNNEIEEETVLKKRARRVSFAETTAVHFFNRDEDSETTPDVDQNASNGKLTRSESDELMELLQSSSSSSDGDSDGGDDDADILATSSFLRPVESPSSGSCFGSATSNDEDKFFGPVSAEFIRSGRLSDSVFSDENHEVTLDSTAFSMNFRSLARSDSGGEFITPTGVNVPFGERTTGLTTTASSIGDSMVLSGARKRVSHSSLPVDKVTDSGNSDDMSIVGVNRRKYEYGELPPELDVLLAEGNQDMVAVSRSGDVECLNFMSAMNGDALNGGEIFYQTGNRDDAASCHATEFAKISGEAISANLVDIADPTLRETIQRNSDHVNDDPDPIIPSRNHDQDTFLQINDIPYGKDKENIGSEVSGIFESPPSITQTQLHHEQPIAGSISSLLHKRRQIFKNSNGLPHVQLNSPLGDKDFRVKGTVDRVRSTSFFTKSVSRLKKLEASFLSASKVEGNASSFTHVDAPVACLDVCFAESDGQFRRAGESDNYGLRNIGIVKGSNCIEANNDGKLSGMRKSFPSPQVSAKRLVSSSAASLETGMYSYKCELEPHNITTVSSIRSDCSLQDITNDLKDSSNTGKLYDFAFSPGTGVASKVSASPLYKGSPFMLNMNDQGQKEAGDLASTLGNYSSLFVEKEDKSKLFSHGINHTEDILQERWILKDQFSSPAKSAHIEIPLKNKVSESCSVLSSNDDDVETRRPLTSFTRGLPAQIMQSSPSSSPCSDARPNKSPVEAIGNPTEEPIHKFTGNHNEDVQLLQNSSSICGSDGSSGNKRKSFHDTESHNDHAVLSQHKPKLCKDHKSYEEQQHKVSHCIGSDSPIRHWTDVFASFCGATKQLLTPMTDKLDVAQIDKLDDILVHLLKLKSYELLHHEKALDSARFLNSKRVAERKLLLHKIVYQKANLLLLGLKRDKLLNHARGMKSRVEESEKLVSNCRRKCKEHEVGQIGSLPSECRPIDNDNRRLVSADICSLRKEFEDSDCVIRKLSKYVSSHIKDMGDLTMTETAASVKGFLDKKVACQSLQSKLQLSKVERLQAMNGQANILFEHGGFMSQSFITKSTATSGLLLTNRVNNEKISKMFIKDIDAHTAFSFVLSGDTQLKYESLKTIAEQTQKTVSALHTLLDVIEEVQLATIELRSLTRSNFCQPSAGKLDLQLGFTDFKSGAKVTLSIDITCVNRGVYPSEVLPYDLRVITAINHDLFESLLSDIWIAVGGVRSGFMRIISICRCVSKMVQAGGMC